MLCHAYEPMALGINELELELEPILYPAVQYLTRLSRISNNYWTDFHASLTNWHRGIQAIIRPSG